MPNPTNPTASPASTATFCVDCGYNLYNLSHDGACPECGTAIALSQDVSVLTTLTRVGLASFDSETTLLAIHFSVAAILMFTYSVLFRFAIPSMVDSMAYQVAALAATTVHVGTWVSAAVLLAARDPSRGESARRTLSYVIITGVILWLAMQCVRMLAPMGLSLYAMSECAHLMTLVGMLLVVVRALDRTSVPRLRVATLVVFAGKVIINILLLGWVLLGFGWWLMIGGFLQVASLLSLVAGAVVLHLVARRIDMARRRSLAARQAQKSGPPVWGDTKRAVRGGEIDNAEQ